ncbi:MAG: DDE-type integrase/transposase/recombinase [Myxococcota bacterium]|nr:DDE-type integrase/transposase/recombinase [Myxococcota bacterium]
MVQAGSRKARSERWAHFRFSVIGTLLAAPPPEGELWSRIEELAAKEWAHPIDGRPHRVGASTIERWYYAARSDADPVARLRRKVRSDAGRRRAISQPLLAALRDQYREYPGWSYKLHADNLAALTRTARQEDGPAPSVSTVRRAMVERAWFRRKKRRNPTAGQQRAQRRLERLEVRSYEVSHVHGLWHYDFHEGSRRVVDARGAWHTVKLLGILDDRSRLCCHGQWYLAETAENLHHGLTQAFCKRGLPRATMSDRGSAELAREIQQGLGDLGILFEPTLEYSPYQNGKQERFWDTVEGRLLAMLDGVEPLTLGFLNQATQAWIEMEYNRSIHEETGEPPLERLLRGPDASRPAPSMERLRQVFTVEEARTLRRTDGTVPIGGVRFEVPSRLRGILRPTVRYRSWDLSGAWIVDARTRDVLARILPIDREANADGRRRELASVVGPDLLPAPVTGRPADPVPPLLRELLEEYAATGLPPAILPKDELLLSSDADEVSRG